MKATFVLHADIEAENFGRKCMLEVDFFVDTDDQMSYCI